MSSLSILVVDDEQVLADELCEYLVSCGHRCEASYHPVDALSRLGRLDPDIVLLDLKLPEIDGLQVLERIRASEVDAEVIVMSGHGDIDSVTRAFQLGAFDFLQKSFRPQDVQLAIERTSKFQQLNRELQTLEERHAAFAAEVEAQVGSAFVGTSEAARRVLELAARAADHADATVLITGESGTGKELIARTIHFQSRRRTAPLVTVNCAAVHHELFESEFFGHVKGAYTGAVARRGGYLRRADGGTLFLDEIGELPSAMQAKLLRVLEYQSFMPVGSDDEERVDVRVIAATNRNLEVASRQGEFRVDLYYRLQAMEIAMPPLRDRATDIPLLVRHFAEELAEQMGRPVPRFDPATLDELERYAFPGNVRELRNAVERAMILGHDRLTVGLPGEATNETDRSARDETLELVPSAERLPTLSLDELERRAVVEALRRSGGVHARAARLLGISRQALLRRMERHGLTDPDPDVY
jgi:two-component system, NtrC family, response regulator AtoC